MNVEFGWKLFTWICQAIRWLTQRSPKRPTLLIVEDDITDAKLLQYRLLKRGYQSEIASTAETALGLVEHQHYSAIFVDMQLPLMSGAALVRILSEQHPSTNIVIICGERSDLGTIPDGIFVGYIAKPPSLEAIEDMLAKLRI